MDRITQNVFSLLSVLRHKNARTITSSLGTTLKVKNYPLNQRPSFWVRLCQAGSLITHDRHLQPTPYVIEWLKLKTIQKWEWALNNWVLSVKSVDAQKRRSRILAKLRSSSQDSVFTPAEIRELSGLRYLGLWGKSAITPLGIAIFEKPLLLETSINYPAWKIEGNELAVPFPADWALIWELETFVKPNSFLKYTLHNKFLRMPGQRNQFTELVSILETGLQAPLPKSFCKELLKLSTIQILSGSVIEFSDTDYLKTLRSDRAFRKDFSHLLSKRHVLLDPSNKKDVIEKLKKRGLLPIMQYTANEETVPASSAHSLPPYLNESECLYTLQLINFAQNLEIPIDPPMGFLDRLKQNLSENLINSAMKRAQEWSTEFRRKDRSPSSSSFSNEYNEDALTEKMLNDLNAAIEQEAFIEIFYTSPTQNHPERRTISPLLLEKHGNRLYLIAYCHKRQSNRTFRVDRLKII